MVFEKQLIYNWVDSTVLWDVMGYHGWNLDIYRDIIVSIIVAGFDNSNNMEWHQ